MKVLDFLQQNFSLIIDQAKAKELIIQAVTAKRSRVYLLIGPAHVGKGLMARILAASFHQSTEINRPHPDTIIFDDILEANSGEGEKKWKQSADDLIRFLNRSPVSSKTKVAIINNIDELSNEAANALLKTLEEPTKSTIIILTAKEISTVLPTIRSRAQIIPLVYITDAEIKDYVISRTKKSIVEIVVLANGAIGRAKDLLSDKKLLENNLQSISKLKTLLSGTLNEQIQNANIKDRDEAIEMLEVWLNLIRRLIHQQITGDNLVNIQQILSIPEMVNDRLVELMVSLRQGLEALKAGANVQIALEAIAIRWTWGMPAIK